MEINIAKTAGFCFGVKRAIKLANEELKNQEVVYSIGNIVHNKYIINELAKKGLVVVENIEDIPDNATVIIRAHGITKDEMNRCNEKKLKIVDTTCPNVKKVHNLVAKYSEEGYNIVIIGEEQHPEVKGIRGWSVKGAIIINEQYDFEQLNNYGKICVVSQTTMNQKKNEEIVRKIQENVKESLIFNTVCSATDERQTELKDIAKKSDAMIIIGDKMSSNSNRLYEISKGICDKSYFIENIDELCLKFLDNSCKIGIMAGASTPSELIEGVVKALETIKSTNEGMDLSE